VASQDGERAASRGRAEASVSGISTHVLDTSRGRPAAGVTVRLERAEDSRWKPVGSGVTDGDGRARDLLSSAPAEGRYRLTFDTAAYFTAAGATVFYPEVSVTFTVQGDEDHYHVPLLLNPFGYSTYRGS
jgi:5-hydroxyisourate hydrolase